MSKQAVVDLFVEDRAHEELLKPLLTRVASQEQIQMQIQVRSARGGHGRAIAEFKLYQRVVVQRTLNSSIADLVVVAIDGNCSTFAEVRRRILAAAEPMLQGRLVAACPDPHIERWYVADPQSFGAIVGHRPHVDSKKCVRDYYKQTLANAIRQAGYPVMLGGVEFASELAEGMDLYRAGKNDSSLKAFLDDLRTKLRQVTR